MKLLEIPVTVSGRVHFLLKPLMGDSQRLNGSRLSEENRNAWDRLLSGRLADWQRDPSQLEDEGVVLPSLETLQQAATVAVALRDSGVDPPLRLVPNGEGGLAFEWRDCDYLWSLELEAEGSLTLSIFCKGRLVSRHQLP